MIGIPINLHGLGVSCFGGDSIVLEKAMLVIHCRLGEVAKLMTFTCTLVFLGDMLVLYFVCDVLQESTPLRFGLSI